MAAWETRIGVTVDPNICYWRTYEFKRNSGACYNWQSQFKWTNTMGVTGRPGVFTSASFDVAWALQAPNLYLAQDGKTYCSIYAMGLADNAALGSGIIIVYLGCNPPEADPAFTNTSVVNFIDYTNFVRPCKTCVSLPPAADSTLFPGTDPRHRHQPLLVRRRHRLELPTFSSASPASGGAPPTVLRLWDVQYCVALPQDPKQHRTQRHTGASRRAAGDLSPT